MNFEKQICSHFWKLNVYFGKDEKERKIPKIVRNVLILRDEMCKS